MSREKGAGPQGWRRSRNHREVPDRPPERNAIENASVKRVPVVWIGSGGKRQTEQELICEFPLTLFVNEQQLVTLLTIPEGHAALAAGYLYSEGWIRDRGDILGIEEHAGSGTVRVRLKEIPEIPHRFWEKRTIGSGCGKPTSFYSALDIMQCKPVSSTFRIPISDVIHWMKEMLQQAPLYHRTHGTHSVALCFLDGTRLLEQDIGRHNAMDRVLGKCLLQGISTEHSVLLTTGRLSSEVVVKAARAGVPILASRSSTTTLAASIAERLNMTILGRMRGGGMSAYAHPERIVAGE